METLFTIIFFLVAAILSAVMRKKQQGQGEEDSWPDPAQSPYSREAEAPSKTLNWEDELRELLEGKIPSSERRSSVPPVVVPVETAPPPIPMPPPEERKSLHDWSKPSKKIPVPARALSGSDAKYARAQNIQARVAKQMKEAASMVNLYREPSRRHHRPKEVAHALRIFRSPRSARLAVIVSEVFGPCKAMRNE